MSKIKSSGNYFDVGTFFFGQFVFFRHSVRFFLPVSPFFFPVSSFFFGGQSVFFAAGRKIAIRPIKIRVFFYSLTGVVLLPVFKIL